MLSEKKVRALRVHKEKFKDLVEVTTPKSNPLTPLGAFSVLPRELRDEIYSHLCNHKYYFSAYPKYPYKKWQSKEFKDLKDHHLSMSTVSKPIRQEFLLVLYAEAVFTIQEGLSKDYVWARRDIPFIDHIQNVKLRTTLGELSYEYWTEMGGFQSQMDRNLPAKEAAPILFFTGTEISRKTCVIQLTFCTPKAILLLQSPFFNAIKQLGAFKSVMLQLLSERGWWLHEDVFDYLGEDPSCVDHAVGLKVLADAMSNALEPSLGPSVLCETTYRGDSSWKITFRPRDYLSRKKSLEARRGAQVDAQAANMTVIEGGE